MSNITSADLVAKYGEDAPAIFYNAFVTTIEQRNTMALLLEKQGVIVTDDNRVGRTGSTDEEGNFHGFDYSSVDAETREHLLIQSSACHVGMPRA